VDSPSYRLRGPHAEVQAPVLDPEQRRVVDHPGGPLLVLAGPGTGKTTTLVEAIVERIDGRGADPASVLALTFSRKAAEQLRDRVTARLGRTTSSTLCATFHSFAYGLVRRYSPADLYVAPLRLLSAPEQDVVLRELLRETPESVPWPASLHHALGTRGFAREVHAVLGRAREHGLEPHALRRLGEENDAPELVAAGLFLEQYLTNLDDQGATDYADLIRRAVIEAAAHRDELRAELRHVFVDEYQDTDPGQVALLHELAGDARDLVAVGDPHQSIYAFRGADLRGILDFPDTFRRTDGAPADVVALRRVRRFGPRILLASRRIAGQLAWSGSIDARTREDFATAESVPGPHGDGRVEVLTFDTDRSEAEHLADLLRRAHLEDGVPWHEMAVLVRSGRSTLPGLRRSLGAAGVPVEVAPDDVPLVADPAVAPLLEALRAALNLTAEDPGHVDFVDAARAESLLLGPLAGLDAGDVRRLARLLRRRERTRAVVGAERQRPSRELIRLAVVDAGFLDGVDGPEAERARSLSRLLGDAASAAAGGRTAEEVLWQLWSGTSWPDRLRRAAEAGGGTARRAHRDLDSVCALFEAAAREEERRDHGGVRNFLASLSAQQIPADTLAERGVRGSAVRLLTAHRAKGLEWRLVVVAHVQQEGWPDLRRRTTLLQADRIGAVRYAGTPLVQPPTTSRELLAEERRLFYVACTRARERLVVTAVASPDDDGEQPSRFLAELGLDPVRVLGRPARPLSLAGLVAELRRTVADPDVGEAVRRAAARRLARLAAETSGARPLVPQADPSSWWGTRAASRAATPVRAVDQPVPISASLLQSVLVCPAQWFLAREAGGVGVAHQSANVGQLVHAVAERVARGDLLAGPDDVEVLMAEVEKVWDRLQFRTPWSRAREHARVRAALARFLQWHHADPRELIGVEEHFSTVVDLPDGERVELVGYADRVELDADGRVVVVDLKTGRTPPTGAAVKRDVQLALYQYAVDSGAVDELVARPVASGGAELVQLGIPDDTVAAVVQPQDAPADDARETLRTQLATAAAMLRAESFPAVTGEHCKTCEFVALCPVKSAGAVLDA